MNTTTLAAPAADLLQSEFMQEMVKQMRALDSYGTFDGWPAERILAPFVLTKEQRRADPHHRRPGRRHPVPRQGLLQRHRRHDRAANAG